MDPRTPPSARPGTLICGKYRVDRMLGEGAMGVVVAATHLALNKGVAIKLLRPEWRTPELVARFEREARVAARLPADHIARVTDTGHTEAGESFLVMELLEGNDLAVEFNRRGRLPIAEAVELILQATAGVAEAHAAGLVHRDIKPANLFLVKRRGGRVTVKVLDFGLSKEPLREGNAELTQSTSNFGTPQYMSPEQLYSAKHVEARSDQHALGMILYELLTGSPPYEAPSLTGLTIAIATLPPPLARALRPEVPLELEAAIVRALAKQPQDRFPDVHAFAQAIAPFAGERASISLEIIAAALDPKGSSERPPSLNAAEAPQATSLEAPLRIAEEDNLETARNVPSPVLAESSLETARNVPSPVLAEVGNAAARTAHSPMDEPSSTGDRDPLALTSDPLRSAARRNPVIVAVVAVMVLAAGLGIRALLEPAPIDEGKGAPATLTEPSAAPRIAPSAAPTTAPSLSPVITPPSASPSSSSSAAPSRPHGTAGVRPGGRSSSSSSGKSPREVFGGD